VRFECEESVGTEFRDHEGPSVGGGEASPVPLPKCLRVGSKIEYHIEYRTRNTRNDLRLLSWSGLIMKAAQRSNCRVVGEVHMYRRTEQPLPTKRVGVKDALERTAPIERHRKLDLKETL
jgi:hypothetical protein